MITTSIDCYVVRIGLLGQLAVCRSADGHRYRGDDEVVCRTRRGLEIGQVVSPINGDHEWLALRNLTDEHAEIEQPLATPTTDSNSGPHSPWQDSNQIMRPLTPEDRLLADRIDRFRDRAFDACQALIKHSGLNATLVDVEHLFDGESLFFYFLGTVPPEIHALTDQLAITYEKRVRFRRFAENLSNGCGPDCGTGLSQCGSSGCGSCSLSSKCKL